MIDPECFDCTSPEQQPCEGVKVCPHARYEDQIDEPELSSGPYIITEEDGEP